MGVKFLTLTNTSTKKHCKCKYDAAVVPRSFAIHFDILERTKWFLKKYLVGYRCCFVTLCQFCKLSQSGLCE